MLILTLNALIAGDVKYFGHFPNFVHNLGHIEVHFEAQGGHQQEEFQPFNQLVNLCLESEGQWRRPKNLVGNFQEVPSLCMWISML